MNFARLLLFGFIGLTFAGKVPEAPQAVLDAAQKELTANRFFKNFDEQKVSMGFLAATKLSDVKLGKPFCVYSMDWINLNTVSPDIPVSKLIHIDSTHWTIPLEENGKCVSFLGIHKEHGQYVAFSQGSNRVAIGWQLVLEQWPYVSGFNPMFVDVSPLSDIFYHIPEQGDSNLTSLLINPDPSGTRLIIPPSAEFKKLTPSKTTISQLQRFLQKQRSSSGNLKNMRPINRKPGD